MEPVVAPGSVADRVADGIYEDHLVVVRSQQVAPGTIGLHIQACAIGIHKCDNIHLDGIHVIADHTILNNRIRGEVQGSTAYFSCSGFSLDNSLKPIYSVLASDIRLPSSK